MPAEYVVAQFSEYPRGVYGYGLGHTGIGVLGTVLVILVMLLLLSRI